MTGPAPDRCSVFRTHGVVKVPLTFVEIVIHENKHNHRVQHETPCKEIYTLLNFYSKLNEPGPAKDLCIVGG